MSRRFTYRRMSGSEIKRALQRLGMPPKAFARICGMDASRLARTVSGEKGFDAPPWFPVMLALLALPGALGIARQVAAEHIIEDLETGVSDPFIEREG